MRGGAKGQIKRLVIPWLVAGLGHLATGWAPCDTSDLYASPPTPRP
jgi:hypothetical protein